MKKEGLTLFEALVVVLLFTILFGLLFEILATGRRSGDIGTTLQDAQVQAKQGLENMLSELYASSASKVTIVNSNTITFQLPIGDDSDGNLIWGADGNSGWGIRYQVNSESQLIRQLINPYPQGAVKAERVLANFVQSTSFSLSGSNLNISLTTQKSTLAGEGLSQALSSAVTFRN